MTKKPIVVLDLDGVLVLFLIVPVWGIRSFIRDLQNKCDLYILTARQGIMLRLAEYWLRILKLEIPVKSAKNKAVILRDLDALIYIESHLGKLRELKDLTSVNLIWFFAYSSYVPFKARGLLRRVLKWLGAKHWFSFSERRLSSFEALLADIDDKLKPT